MLVPLQPGRLVVDGADVSYTAGWRRGTDHLRGELTIEAVDADGGTWAVGVGN